MIFIKIVPLISALGKTPLSIPSIFRVVLGQYKMLMFGSCSEVISSCNHLQCRSMNSKNQIKVKKDYCMEPSPITGAF